MVVVGKDGHTAPAKFQRLWNIYIGLRCTLCAPPPNQFYPVPYPVLSRQSCCGILQRFRLLTNIPLQNGINSLLAFKLEHFHHFNQHNPLHTTSIFNYEVFKQPHSHHYNEHIYLLRKHQDTEFEVFKLPHFHHYNQHRSLHTKHPYLIMKRLNNYIFH